MNYGNKMKKTKMFKSKIVKGVVEETLQQNSGENNYPSLAK